LAKTHQETHFAVQTFPVTVASAVLNDRRVRYVMTGGLGSAVYYGLFSLGWLLLSGQVPYLGLAILANFATGLVTYPLFRQRVFGATGPLLAGFLRFYLISLGGLAFSLLGLPLLVEVVRTPVLIAQAIILIVWPVVNYQVLKLWAFRKR
jgi:putative flippase GtrA